LSIVCGFVLAVTTVRSVSKALLALKAGDRNPANKEAGDEPNTVP
jgi:hypothetical protein